MEKKIYKVVSYTGNEKIFSNLKKAYQFYLLLTPKYQQLSYSSIANYLKKENNFCVDVNNPNCVKIFKIILQ